MDEPTVPEAQQAVRKNEQCPREFRSKVEQISPLFRKENLCSTSKQNGTSENVDCFDHDEKWGWRKLQLHTYNTWVFIDGIP